MRRSRFDTPAYLDTTVNRVRVPIRFVSEMMGAQVSWDQANRRVTIYFPAVTREVMKAVPAPGYDYPDLIHPESALAERSPLSPRKADRQHAGTDHRAYH